MTMTLTDPSLRGTKQASTGEFACPSLRGMKQSSTGEFACPSLRGTKQSSTGEFACPSLRGTKQASTGEFASPSLRGTKQASTFCPRAALRLHRLTNIERLPALLNLITLVGKLRLASEKNTSVRYLQKKMLSLQPVGAIA
ncbi:MAG: hypothetical protein LBL58_05220 [Tannerellaceae bacterium]|jgi:hypothetical protein|nr:hypothetical protein [Tannerellaceae bacterium]